MRLGGKLVKLRITIRIIRTPRRAGTPLRGAHVLNVMGLQLHPGLSIASAFFSFSAVRLGFSG